MAIGLLVIIEEELARCRQLGVTSFWPNWHLGARNLAPKSLKTIRNDTASAHGNSVHTFLTGVEGLMENRLSVDAAGSAITRQ